jgi:hypothetical protein
MGGAECAHLGQNLSSDRSTSFRIWQQGRRQRASLVKFDLTELPRKYGFQRAKQNSDERAKLNLPKNIS